MGGNDDAPRVCEPIRGCGKFLVAGNEPSLLKPCDHLPRYRFRGFIQFVELINFVAVYIAVRFQTLTGSDGVQEALVRGGQVSPTHGHSMFAGWAPSVR